MRAPRSAILLCFVLGAAACGGAPAGDRQGATEPPAWTTYDIPEASLAVTYPSSWTRSVDPLLPDLVDPKVLVALSTFPARPGGENCAHLPENAIEDMGPTDALVVIEERLGDSEDGAGRPSDYPGRPAQFGPSSGYPTEAVDCLGHRKAFSDYLIPFGDSGRVSLPMSRSGPRPRPTSAPRPGRSWTASRSGRPAEPSTRHGYSG